VESFEFSVFSFELGLRLRGGLAIVKLGLRLAGVAFAGMTASMGQLEWFKYETAGVFGAPADFEQVNGRFTDPCSSAR
jgi:hypothetical protein